MIVHILKMCTSCFVVRSRANCVPIYGDLYQNLQWSLTFNLKVVAHLKSASEASYDVINMATIIKKTAR